MLKIQGSLKNGKEFPVETVISRAEVLAALAPDLLPKKNIEFRKLVKVDQFGQEQYPLTYSIPAVVNVDREGVGSFSLRYFRSTKPGPGGLVDHLPKNLVFGGKAMFLEGEALDMAIIYYLSNECEQSPGGSDAKKIWRLYDADTEGIQKEVQIKTIMGLYAAIANASEEEIVSRALGIQIGNETISPQPNASLYRHELIQMLNRHQEKFFAAWNNATTVVRGTLMNAFNAGIIEMSTKHGLTKFTWVGGTQDGVLIKEFNGSAVGIEDLITWVRSSPTGEDVLDYAKKLLASPRGEASMETKGTASAPEAARVIEEDKLVAMVDDAIRLGVIFLDINTKNVLITKGDEIVKDEDGNPVVITTAKGLSTWRDEVIGTLRANNSAAKSLRMRVMSRQQK